MAIATVQFMSQALWRMVTYTALLPEGEAIGAGPFPVLYQLHGGNEDHTAWLHQAALARRVRDLPLIVVLPAGAQSRWANGGAPFENYEDFLVHELSAHIRRTFHATTDGWAIGGNSMGGFGAVRLGLKYPGQFVSICAHSGVYPRAGALPEHWHWPGVADDLDCYALVERLDRDTVPCLALDCGVDDHLLASNRQFHAFLEARQIPHTYREYPGGHNWDYWSVHLDDALRQHVAVLGLHLS